MKISKEKLWEAIFKVSPWMEPSRRALNFPKALEYTCVDIVMYAEDDENRVNFDYSMAVFYIRSALLELKEMGVLSFPQDQN